MTNTSNLSEKIAKFYDTSSNLWEKTWGEHMHHGYYGRGGNYKLDRRQAQINLIEELLIWADIKEVSNLVDVGCGIGGSTLYLAERFNTKATGITLSSVQANRATERASEFKLEETVQFQVADALNMPFPEDNFDLVWSLESAEHMPDKKKFFQECYRVLKPGGTFLCVTWCHRPTNSWAGELTEEEKQHLEEIYRVYCLPYVLSLPEYETIAQDCGFSNIKVDDWSMEVAPFWDIVIDSALNLETIAGLLNSGWQTVQGALSLGLMSRGYERGLIRFGLIYGQK
ncbi:methyltransferase domain-containing protein [Crocosphaera watsonii]|uniref:Gamma-tocopherol C-methyltransferase n=1 Tax=Crocosphaera watsonii WH 8502 TaxID=423474 RepID=T2IEN3_CROWT|nr:methyltransferase domain-containing protein [Crocosphaera watsonii]CCQ50685.1 Gamma-tocopherol C-methyltransferase [Crocosphaera watsonii WH 8502]